MDYTAPGEESCFEAIIGSLGFILLLLVCAGACMFRGRNRKDAEAQALLGEVTAREQVQVPPLLVADRAWHQSHDKLICNCCPGERLLARFADQPPTKWAYWWKSQHSYLWIWYPAPNEVLKKHFRFLVVITVVLFNVLLQVLFASAAGVDATTSTSARNMTWRVPLVSILKALFGFLYKPLLILAVTHECLGKHMDSLVSASASRLVRIASVLVNIAIAVVVLVMMFTVLRDYTCQGFLFGVILPFLLTELYDSFTVGIIILWIRYQLMNSCGKELPESSPPTSPQ